MREKIYPAHMCAKIAEAAKGTVKVFVTSPTKIGYINSKAKGIYGVKKMNGSEIKTFDTLDEAIAHANIINNSDTLVVISVRLYRHSTYSALAEVYKEV